MQSESRNYCWLYAAILPLARLGYFLPLDSIQSINLSLIIYFHILPFSSHALAIYFCIPLSIPDSATAGSPSCPIDEIMNTFIHHEGDTGYNRARSKREKIQIRLKSK